MKSNIFYRTLLGVFAAVLLISCGSKGNNTPEIKKSFPEKGAIYLSKSSAELQRNDGVVSAAGIYFAGNGMGEYFVLLRSNAKSGFTGSVKVSYDATKKVLTLTTSRRNKTGKQEEVKLQFKYDETYDTLTEIPGDSKGVALVLKRSKLKRSDLDLIELTSIDDSF